MNTSKQVAYSITLTISSIPAKGIQEALIPSHILLDQTLVRGVAEMASFVFKTKMLEALVVKLSCLMQIKRRHTARASFINQVA
jgi:hypothetical protein